jgi:hypothetical protein
MLHSSTGSNAVMKDENTVSQEVQIQARHFNCTLMRNNSGACLDATGRMVRYGLGNISAKQNAQIKSSDLIGITQIKITPDMVGKTVGIFTALEVKKEAWKPEKKLDKRETAQFNFIEWVKLNGGYADFIKSVDDLPLILRQ